MVKELVEKSWEILLYSYALTFLAAPAIVGYISGRYTNLVVRGFFALWITLAGYLICTVSAHGFLEAYFPGNLLYVGMCVLGLSMRARAKKKKFWSQHHFDWMLVGLATIVFRIFYIRPAA